MRRVLEEEHEHYGHILATLTKVQQQGIGWRDASPDDAAAVLVHHHSLLRNKRCLLAYVHHRMAKIQGLRWQLGAVLPPDVAAHMSAGERDMFRAYSALLGQHMAHISLDLTVDAAPPKDNLISVRVVENTGVMLFEDKEYHQDANSLHLVSRADVEGLILQGRLQQCPDF
eukprot:SM000107S14088  [mRNA]  locus=s107:291992:293162:- [translate_table: standard]